jgi:electron transport complex protein RnfB
LVRKYCKVGCIGCQICVKVSLDSFEVTNFLAKVKYQEAADPHAAVSKCPTKCIRDFATGYPEGSTFGAADSSEEGDAA